MSEWVDTDEICPSCDYNGKHLLIANDEALFCGRCNRELITVDIVSNDE